MKICERIVNRKLTKLRRKESIVKTGGLKT